MTKTNPELKRAFLELHASILLAGWTGVFGKLISLSAGLLVFWRVAVASALFCLWASISRRVEHARAGERIGMMLVGVLLLMQWTLFYAAIKASNVSIGVVAFSSVGFFTALLEPLIARRAVRLQEILFSIITILGIALIFRFDAQYRLGILFGLASAAASALLAIFFRQYRARFSAVTVLHWQLLGALAASLALLPLYRSVMPPEPFFPEALDLAYLLIFATLCTIGMYLLQIQALERISAFTVNLSYNLEPVYSILIAMILFDEARALNWSFWTGLLLIGASVLLQTGSVLRAARRAS